MYYPDEIIEEVRLNSDVIDVIGSYVHLQKKGSSYFGLCPFHHEKSPSFSVSKEKQMYYCFGCGAGGNVISFIMAYENYSFVEALRFLADRAHITLPEAEISEEMRNALNYKQRLYDTNRQAAVFYYRMLYSEVGRNALAYFDHRGVQEEIRKRFALGYATILKDDLMNYLLSKGFTKKEMLDCGLIIEDKGKTGVYHNRFFNRIMFPILDVHGRVIAFGGRVMGEGEPKYLNSPETTLFDKSRNLYGLHLARKSKNHHFMIIVEGYMDVIALHQAGFDNAIAALGTAFTSGHGQLIKRYTDEVVLCFDSDMAGTKAALRAIPILKSSGLVVRVLRIQEYKDPDEYIREKGKDRFEELLKTAIPSFMFEVRMLSQNYDLKDPEYKTRFSEELAKKLILIEGQLERENYMEAVIREYDISKNGLLDLMGRLAKNVGIVNKNEANHQLTVEEKRLKQKPDADTIAQKEFLAIVVSHEKIYRKVKNIISPEYFTHEVLSKVAWIVYDLYEKQHEIEPAMIMSKFTQIEDQKLIAALFSEEIKAENQQQLERHLNDTLQKIKSAYLDRKQQLIKEPNELMALIREKKELTSLYIRLEEIE